MFSFAGLFLQLDYRRGVQEVDEKQALTMRLIVSELRNQYVCTKIFNLCHTIIPLWLVYYTN